jgi:hypothetical protein
VIALLATVYVLVGLRASKLHLVRVREWAADGQADAHAVLHKVSELPRPLQVTLRVLLAVHWPIIAAYAAWDAAAERWNRR